MRIELSPEPTQSLAEQVAAIIGVKSTEVQVARGDDFIEVRMLSGKRPKEVVGDVPLAHRQQVEKWAQSLLP